MFKLIGKKIITILCSKNLHISTYDLRARLLKGACLKLGVIIKAVGKDNATPWVKVFRVIPEFRILRLTFHRKSASKC